MNGGDSGGTSTTDATKCYSGRGNYLHTSHTVLDPPSWDLLWLRGTFKRNWGCDAAWWSRRYGRVFGWTGRGPSWWDNERPEFPFVQWSHPPTRNRFTILTLEGRGSVDFGHCGDPDDRKQFLLIQHVTSYRDGDKDVDFTKRGHCFGLHSATGVKTNGDKFGGYSRDNPTTKTKVANAPD